MGSSICRAALIALNDLETGLPVAVMDGNWITGDRTAAVSAAATAIYQRATAKGPGTRLPR